MGLIFTIIFVLLNLLSPADFYPDLAGSRYIFFVAIAAIVFSIPALLKAKPFKLVQSTFWFGVLFIAMVSSAWNGWLGGSLIIANAYVTAAAAFFLIMANATTPARIRAISTAAILTATFFVLYGSKVVATTAGMEDPRMLSTIQKRFVTFQAVSASQLSTQSSTLSFLGSSRLYILRLRALGELNDPNDLAQFLLVCICLLALWYQPNKKLRNFLIIGVPSLYLLYGIFLTDSRGGLVARGRLLVLWCCRRVGSVSAFVMSGLMGLGVLLLGFTGGRGISAQEGEDRIAAWREGFQMLKMRPFVGVVMHNLTEHYPITAHNSFILVFAELGLLGDFCCLGMLIASFFGLRWVIQGEESAEQLAAAAAVGKFAPNPLLAKSQASVSDQPQRDEIAFAARIVRIARFAFLAADWFLSRAFVLPLYMLLGMAAALIIAEKRRHPDRTFLPTGKMLRYTMVAEFASITGIYLLLRVLNLTNHR